MLPLLRLAAALALISSVAVAEDYRVVAELGRAGGDKVESVSVLPLSPGGPPFVVSVGRSFVNAWRAGRVAEPLVSPLSDVWVGGPSPAFGDFDGDGRIDLAVITSTGVAVLRGDGAGRFGPAGVLSLDPVAVLVAADIDGDGRADLVTVQSNQVPEPVFSVHRSRGGFSFDPPRTTVDTASFSGVFGITPADMDGDGVVDLVVSPGRGGPRIWKGTGVGTFTVTSTEFKGYAVGTPLVADLDGDGRPEIIYRNSYPYTYLMPLEILHNDGGGTFHVWAEPQMTRSVTGPFLGDFDGDGRPDVGFVDVDQATGERHLAWYRPSGGTVVEARAPVPGAAVALAAGDWDGDGRAEIFLRAKLGIPVLGLHGARTDVFVVPVVLSTTGLYGARFDSDLLLTNSGSTSAHLTLRYTASAGGGSGIVERDLAAGRQLYAGSAVGFLRDAGLAIAGGNAFGSLRIEVSGASSPRAVSASVRTTTPSGAGVAFGASPSVAVLREPAILPWLVESNRDRTNLGLVNAGANTDGPVTLRTTVFPGSPGSEPPATLPDVTLQPGEFFQYGRVLAAAGLVAPVGWARIVRVAGDAPYLAWAAVNDAGSGDGSFEAATAETASSDSVVPFTWVVANAVQTGRYATEFVATNPGTDPVTLDVTLVATGTILRETIAPGATFYLPDLFAELRRRGLAGAPAVGVDVVSPLYIQQGDVLRPVFAGIRVSSSPSPGISFGVFEAAMPNDAGWGLSAVVPDLRYGAGVRTNLGIVNPYVVPQTFQVEIVDGETGAVAATTTVGLAVNEVRQINAVLPALAPATKRAYARVTPVGLVPYSPTTFFAYAVVNDGPVPGAGTDDGSFVAGIPE